MKKSLYSIGLFFVSVLLLAGFVVWSWSIKSIDQEIVQKQAALKQLDMSGSLPPNKEVMSYLSDRALILEKNYHSALSLIVHEPESAMNANPQLYFQQRLHDVQRSLEKLASARQAGVPQNIGFPKELPPVDVVPMLLVQLDLIEDVSKIIMSDKDAQLGSIKIEDSKPALTAEDEDKEGIFLNALPVSFRFAGSLKSLSRVIGTVEGLRPIVNLDGIRIRQLSGPSEGIEAELKFSRYVISGSR